MCVCVCVCVCCGSYLVGGADWPVRMQHEVKRGGVEKISFTFPVCCNCYVCMCFNSA